MKNAVLLMFLLALMGHSSLAQGPGTTSMRLRRSRRQACPAKKSRSTSLSTSQGPSDPIHRHDAQAMVYVLEGSVVMQVAGGTFPRPAAVPRMKQENQRLRRLHVAFGKALREEHLSRALNLLDLRASVSSPKLRGWFQTCRTLRNSKKSGLAATVAAAKGSSWTGEAIGRREGRNHSREVDGVGDSFLRRGGGFSSILPKDARRVSGCCGDNLETAKL
jgi:hypothetical protein